MIPQIEAAKELQSFCMERQWSFCIIGGLAVIRWGEPRATQDVDVTLFAGFDNEEFYIQELLGRFQSRVAKALDFAIKNRVLLITASNGIDIDVSLGGLPYEKQIVQRASLFLFSPETSLLTCSVEDLIVLKAFASRGKDWVDIEGILIRQGKHLDWNYIDGALRPLCELKGNIEILKTLSDLRAKIMETPH